MNPEGGSNVTRATEGIEEPSRTWTLWNLARLRENRDIWIMW